MSDKSPVDRCDHSTSLTSFGESCTALFVVIRADEETPVSDDNDDEDERARE
jgi:hypothetical protein